jgi:hypothetical protein
LPALCDVKFRSTMFKTGQKVVCINTKEISNSIFNSSIVKLKDGEIYTVKLATPDGLLLNEVRSSHPTGEFNIDRFRPIDDDWVEELLCKVMSEVEANELVSV